mgnify:FL=1
MSPDKYENPGEGGAERALDCPEGLVMGVWRGGGAVGTGVGGAGATDVGVGSVVIGADGKEDGGSGVREDDGLAADGGVGKPKAARRFV